MATSQAQDNNPQATQAANAAYFQANPNVFGGATTATAAPTNQTPTPAPTLANGQTAGSAQTGTQAPPPPTTTATPPPTGLQMPTGAAANSVYDPTTGQQVSPAEAALNAQKASGTQAPQDSSTGVSGAGVAIQGANSLLPPDNSGIEAQLANDPGYQQLLADRAEYTKVANQSVSLLDTYNKMIQSSGIAAMNTELLNTKKIIEGTEDDIRKEVQAAGGFATDSQVLALSSARNKQLIKNYNALLDAKTSAQEQVNTMIGLAAKDREFALKSITQKMQIDQQLNEYRDKFINNAKEAYNNVIKAVGYGGLYKSLVNSGDPNAVSLAERNLGLAPGGLQQLANYVKPLTASEQLDLDTKKFQLQQAQSEAPLDLQLKKAQLANIKSEIANRGPSGNTSTVVDTGNGKVLLTYNKQGHIISQQPIQGNASVTQPQQQAVAKAGIDLVDSLQKSKGLNSAVGPNAVARGIVPLPFGLSFSYGTDAYTGQKQNFIAGVQQLTSQLTLDNLIKAKAQGATFGALSEGELNILAGGATKLNSWAQKDKEGNVSGYDVSEGEFKKELDKIGNFARLDYILKGGSPADVGVQVMPDGTHWIKNSDGTMTQL